MKIKNVTIITNPDSIIELLLDDESDCFTGNRITPHDELQAEIERLRGLLRAIIEHPYADECQECGIGHSTAWKEARVALKDNGCRED